MRIEGAGSIKSLAAATALVKDFRNGILVALVVNSFLFILLIADQLWATNTQAFGLSKTGFFQEMNLHLYDNFFKWRGSSVKYAERESRFAAGHSVKGILLLYLDKLTLEYARTHFHEDFPWPRSRYSGIIRDLKKAKASAIGVDILFTSPGKRDEVLASALKGSNAVLASRYVFSKGVIQEYDPPIFPGSLGIQWGFVNASWGQEDVLRQVPVFLPTRFSKSPWSFDLQILRLLHRKEVRIQSEDLQVGSVSFPVESVPLWERKQGAPAGAFLTQDIQSRKGLLCNVNYARPNLFLSYPLFFLWDKNRKTVMDTARDKIVLIGANALALPEEFWNDIFNTPVGMMNGLEVHANVLFTLLEGKPLLDFQGFHVVLVSLFCLAVSYGLMIPLSAGWLRFVIGLIIILAECLVAYALFWYYSVRLPLFQSLTASVLDFGSISFYFYTRVAREMGYIKDLFAGYLSPKVVETLLQSENRNKIQRQLSKGEKVTVTILYSDIRGFTKLAEKLGPEQVVSLLNEYLPPMITIVHEFGGYLDKFIGDAVMAVFTAPFPEPDDPWRAVQVALRMQEEMKNLREKWKKEGQEMFEIGIGINTGDVILGNLGSQYKKDYTVIGDPVNVAAHLCGLAGGGEILISDATYRLVQQHVEVRDSGPVQVKGRRTRVQVYTITREKLEMGLV